MGKRRFRDLKVWQRAKGSAMDNYTAVNRSSLLPRAYSLSPSACDL